LKKSLLYCIFGTIKAFCKNPIEQMEGIDMKRVLIGLIVVALMIIPYLISTLSPSVEYIELSDSKVKQARNLLQESLVNSKYSYFDYLSENSETSIDANYEVAQSERFLKDGDITYNVTVDESGYYFIEFDYELDKDILNNLTMRIEIDGQRYFDEMDTIDVPIYWRDETKEFVLDSYEDESLPVQIKSDIDHRLKMYNNTYYTAEPMMFWLEKGAHDITLSSDTKSNFSVSNMYVNGVLDHPTYDEYHAMHNAELVEEFVSVNAISYIEKNSSYTRLMALQNASTEPFDPVYKKLNVIFGESFNLPGQEITYELDVPKTGNYELAFHYQSDMNDFSVFRTFFIDGEVPFEEMKSYAFAPTASSFANETLNKDGVAYQFYLEEGTHTLTIRNDFEKIAPLTKDLQLIIDHINQFAIDIRKVTGQEVDENRTWRLTKFIPETADYLDAYDVILRNALQTGASYAPNGIESSTLSYLNKALKKLEVISENPDELPLYFDELLPLFSSELGGNTSTITQMVGDTLNLLTSFPMTLDMIYLTGGEDLPKPNASAFTRLGSTMTQFVASFTNDKYNVKNDPDAINVWVNRPLTHVDTLQKLVDSEFTTETGIKVKISVMPDANKLVLASAAGETPDVALGLLSYMPFDLAIRNAAYDLSTFDDFWSHSNNFIPGAFVPYILEDGVYALPETLDFQALVYRKDIFENLDIPVPDTWAEVIDILPILQRYGMNFYHPTAGGGAIKWFYQTSPFIYQLGGSLYSEDGLRTTINEEDSVKGLEFLNDFYTLYSLPAQVPLFYDSFRYGGLPIGIANFNEYLQIKNAAPELRGQWELSNFPGVENDQGEIERWYIANGTGMIIMKDTEYPKESWEFLKWWTSTETQTTYSFLLQSTYGPEFVWLSSNVNAVQNLPIGEKDKEIILEQVKWLRDVPRTPGQYLLERGISDVWNAAVFDGVPTRVAIDRQVISINREIKRKMIEFGYLDADGNVLIPYTIRDVDWIEEQMGKE
jgi:ABC-type glycerol-3-phosphate transport system substrate-binding protein